MPQNVRRSAAAAPLHVHASVPSYFLCPISLELMRDPVTLTSGQTFDRESIEAWLEQGHDTCPITRLPIDAAREEPIPNHALRRMIQAWCVQHKSLGVERIATPRAPASAADVRRLVEELGSKTSDSLDLLHRLNRIALDQPRSRKHMLHSGALSLLPPLVLDSDAHESSSASPANVPSSYSRSSSSCSTPRGLIATKDEQALRLLSLLLDDAPLAASLWHPSDDEIASIARFIAARKSDSALDVKAQNAAIILSNECTVLSDATKKRVANMDGFLGGLVKLIRCAQFSDPAACNPALARAASAALKLLQQVCGCSTRCRVQAVEAGAVEALVDRVKEVAGPQRSYAATGRYQEDEAGASSSSGELKASAEASLKALGVLCQCAEGRAAVAGGRLTMRTVVKAMSGVSERASRHAAVVVWQVLKRAPVGSPAKREALEAGGFVKAVALAQCSASAETRHVCGSIARALGDAIPATATVPHSLRL